MGIFINKILYRLGEVIKRWTQSSSRNELEGLPNR